MRNFAFPFVTVVLLSSSAAIAGDPAPAPQPAQSAAQAQPAADTILDGNKLECRLMGAKTGSRLGARRECRTKREWSDIQQQNAHEIEKMQARDAMVPH